MSADAGEFGPCTIFDSIIKPIQNEGHLEQQPTTKSSIQLHTTDSTMQKSIGEQNTLTDASSQEGPITQITMESSHTYAKELLPSTSTDEPNNNNNNNNK